MSGAEGGRREPDCSSTRAKVDDRAALQEACSMNVDVLDEIWCCFPDAHAGQICATVEGVGSRRAPLATERFPSVALLHQDRPTVSDGDHLCGEASSQEKRWPRQEAAGHNRSRATETARTRVRRRQASAPAVRHKCQDGASERQRTGRNCAGSHHSTIYTWMRRPYDG